MFQIKLECSKDEPRPDECLKLVFDNIIESHTDENITDLVRSWKLEPPISCELGSWLWEFASPYKESDATDLQTIIQNKLIGLYESGLVYDAYIKIIYEEYNHKDTESFPEDDEAYIAEAPADETSDAEEDSSSSKEDSSSSEEDEVVEPL